MFSDLNSFLCLNKGFVVFFFPNPVILKLGTVIKLGSQQHKMA